MEDGEYNVILKKIIFLSYLPQKSRSRGSNPVQTHESPHRQAFHSAEWDCRSSPVQFLRSAAKGAHLLPETPGFYSPVTDCNLPAGSQFHNHRLSRKHSCGSRLCPALHPAGVPPLWPAALPYPRKPAPPVPKTPHPVLDLTLPRREPGP